MTINSDPQLNDTDLELLSAYMDRRLSDGERAALERRLSQEPTLRAVLGELRATVGLLRQLEPLRPPRSFTIVAPDVVPRRFWSFSWPAISSAVVALVCLLTFGYALIRSSSISSSSPAAAPAPAAVQEAAAPTAAAAGAGAPNSAMRQAATAAPAAAAPTAAPAAEAPVTAAEAPAAPMAAAEASTAAPAAAAPIATQAALPAPTAMAAAGAIASEPTAVPAAADSAAPTAALPANAALKDTAATVQQPYSALVATSEISSPGTVTLDQPPIGPAANSAPSDGSRNLGLIAGVVLVLLVVVGFALALRRRKRT